MSETSSKKRKLSLPLIVAGGVSSLVLALGMSPTFSAFSASITNGNTATAGTLIMQETPTTGTPCNSNDLPKTLGNNNDASCTINLFGGAPMYPGQTVNTTVTIKNTGTITPTTFSLTPGSCTPTLGTPNGGVALANVCAKFNVKIYLGSSPTTGTLQNTTATQQTAAGFTTALDLPTLVATTGTQQYTISVQLDTSADNTYQGVSISMPLTWKFQA